jgi:hypothetical protein
MLCTSLKQQQQQQQQQDAKFQRGPLPLHSTQITLQPSLLRSLDRFILPDIVQRDVGRMNYLLY